MASGCGVTRATGMAPDEERTPCLACCPEYGSDIVRDTTATGWELLLLLLLVRSFGAGTATRALTPGGPVAPGTRGTAIWVAAGARDMASEEGATTDTRPVVAPGGAGGGRAAAGETGL